jgi:predicted GNAT family acetyltransferase
MRKVASTITSRWPRGAQCGAESEGPPAAIRLLSANPIENVFVASRVRAAGLEQASLGCPVWGYERGGLLRALCHAGSNLVPVNADELALEAWTEFAGPNRMCASIIGPSHTALELWSKLSERWGGAWSDVRDVRPHQPVMSISSPPAIPVDRRVRRVTIDQWDAYTEAAVKMYTEEIGVSPVQANPAGYRFYVRQLIASGRAFGIFDGNRVLFKADLGSVSGSVCQVQGVWLEPELRGQGLAAPAMAAVVQLTRTVFPTVSLYVNGLQPTCAGDIREWGSPRSANSRRSTWLGYLPGWQQPGRSVDDLVRLR